jgi:hypothetical protein
LSETGENTIEASTPAHMNEQHPLYHLLDTLGTLIEVYETEHYPLPNCHKNDVLD